MVTKDACMKKILLFVLCSVSVSSLICMKRKASELGPEKQTEEHIEKKLKIEEPSVVIKAYNQEYILPKNALNNSLTLKKKFESTDASELDLSTFLQDITSQEIWGKVIIQALIKGNAYTLSNRYSFDQFVKIINTARLLDMPYLLSSALEVTAAYIVKNPSAFARNAEEINLFKKNLPDEMLQRITSAISDRLKIGYYNFRTLTLKDSNPVSLIACSKDGKTLASWGPWGKREIKLWNVHTKRIAGTIATQEEVTSLAFNPKYDVLASGFIDGTIKLWKIEPKKLTTLETLFTTEMTTMKVKPGAVSVAFSSNGDIFAYGSVEGISLWDMKNMNVITLGPDGAIVKRIALSPDGSTLASVSREGSITVWDIKRKKTLTTPAEDKKGVRSVAFSPDSKILAFGSNDGTINFLDIENKQLTIFSKYAESVDSVAFSPDGKILASGSSDTSKGDLELWDVKSKQKLASLFSRKKGADAIAFSPNGTILAAGFGDGEIKLWFRPIFSFEQILLRVYVLAFRSIDVSRSFNSDPIAKLIQGAKHLEDIYATFNEEQKDALIDEIENR